MLDKKVHCGGEKMNEIYIPRNQSRQIEAIEIITIMISPLLLAVFYSLCVLNGVVFLIPLVICFVVFIVASYFYLTYKKVKK